MRAVRTALSALAVALLAAGPALAHPQHAHANLSAGLAHPFGGLDHILAMVAVGLLAARRGGSAAAWPLAFLAAMIAGFGLGAQGVLTLSVEPAVVASVILLGGLVAGPRISARLSLAAIGLAGLCHGFVHGAETQGSAGFALGMLATTAILHAAGFAAGAGLRHITNSQAITRTLGGGVGLGGLALAVAGLA
jgi:urease accessory protein